MDSRDGFYFYRSFWESISLMSAKDQAALLRAVIEFGLDGKEPEGLTKNQKASFLLIRPTLVSGRKKAASGKKGGNKKKANGKQTESKEEDASGLLLSDKGQGSNPNGLRQGLSDKGVNDSPALNDGSLFTLFWDAYPKKQRREHAWTAWKKLNPTQEGAASIMEHLDAWKLSKRWIDDNGEFIPNAENFLDPEKGYLSQKPAPAKQATPKGASGKLGAAELEAMQDALSGRTAARLFGNAEGT